MKERFAKFMSGRRGMDELARFFYGLTLLFLILSLLIPNVLARFIFLLLAIAATVLTFWRCLSKNLNKRWRENERYLRRTERLRNWFRLRRDMWQQRKEYKFFKCPACRAVLRVPKGKGKVRIVCRKCGTAFEKKT
ncbi:MAG: hypothetical protein ACOX66_05845 [Oscillospiraceae bacterium]